MLPAQPTCILQSCWPQGPGSEGKTGDAYRRRTTSVVSNDTALDHVYLPPRERRRALVAPEAPAVNLVMKKALPVGEWLQAPQSGVRAEYRLPRADDQPTKKTIIRFRTCSAPFVLCAACGGWEVDPDALESWLLGGRNLAGFAGRFRRRDRQVDTSIN